MKRWYAAVLCVVCVAGIRVSESRALVSLDQVFSPVFGTPGAVTAIAPLSNGRIVAAGTFTTINGVPRIGIAVINADGMVDPSFTPPPEIDITAVDALAVDAGGRILVGGTLSHYSTEGFKGHLFRLNSDGSRDTTFDAGGYDPASGQSYGLDNRVRAVAVDGSGKILVGGEFTSPHRGLTRLNSDGSPDDTFAPGSGADGAVTSIVITPSGMIVIGGEFTTVNGAPKAGIARLSASGVLDSGAFGTGVSGGVVKAMALQTDGKTVIGGTFTRGGRGGTVTVRPFHLGRRRGHRFFTG